MVFHDGLKGNFNNTTLTIDDDNYLDEYSSVIVDSIPISDKYVNVTHFKIVIMKDNEIVFNITKPFNMNHKLLDDIYPKYLNSDSEDNSDSSSFNSVSTSTYVASSNFNKFHEPYCSQAQKISDANKITFSSRDEAINAGYESCGICYP